LALAGEASGIVIDLSVYLEPRGLDALGDVDPALGTLTVASAHFIREDNHGLDHKSSLPIHPKTLQLIEREIALVALGIPPPPRSSSAHIDLVTPIPAPREKIPSPKALSPDWDFLRPRHPGDVLPPELRHGEETLPLPKTAPDLPNPRLVPDGKSPDVTVKPK
jgi:hypothetical protein